MVLAYSIFGMLALLLVHPLREQGAKSWVHWFHKIFFYTLIPLVILLFVAINTRLLQYGFTEARCFVLLTALWLAGMVCYFLFFKKSHIKIIPISLFLILALSLIVPYFNVFSVSVRSQENDLKKLLTENQLLVNGKIDFKKEIADSVADNIVDKFEFLSERFKNKSLASYLNDDVKKSFKDDKIWHINGLFTNVVNKKDNNRSNNFILYNQNTYFYTQGYSYIVTENQLNRNEVNIQGDQFKLDQNSYNDAPFYKLTLNEKTTVDFMPLIIEKFKPYKTMEGDDTAKDLSVSKDLGPYQVKIEFSSINRNQQEKVTHYYMDNAVIFIRKK
jgi:energy-coupling factor transporter transmembrane protein EcfT